MVDTHLQHVRLLTRIIKVTPEMGDKLGVSTPVLDRLKMDGAHIDLAGYITLSQASDKYPVSRVTLCSWARKGYLGTGERRGKEVLYRESRIRELVEVFEKEGGPGKRYIAKFAVSHPA